MNKRTPRPTSAWLAESGLRALLNRVEIHKRLLAEIRSALPAPLAEHCRDCAVNDGHLIVYTDGQNWSFQLRFHANDLLARLKTTTAQTFRSLRTRCLAQERPHPGERRNIGRITPETVSIIEHFSSDAASDDLSKALSRLAATLRKRTADN